MPFPRQMTLPILLTTASSLFSACTVLTIRIDEQPLPESIVVPLPLTVGVIHDEAILQYEHVEETVIGNIISQPGAAIVAAFDDAFNASFEEIREIDQLPLEDAIARELDIVASMRIRNFHSSTYGTASLAVDVILETPDGDYIDTVSVATRPFGARPIEFSDIFNSGYEREATQTAARSAAAQFIMHFRESPGLRAWLDGMNAYRESLPSRVTASSIKAIEPPEESSYQAGTVGTVVILSDTDDHARCLERHLLDADESLEIMAGADFVEAFFPWFDTVSAFDNLSGAAIVERYNSISQSPPIAERVTELNLGHLIVINGETIEGDIVSGEHEDSWGGCVGGVGGGICMGMQYADKTSRLWAEVLDLRESGPIRVQEFEHTVSDEIVWPTILIPLIPFNPNTDREVCEILGPAVAERVLGGALNNSD